MGSPTSPRSNLRPADSVGLLFFFRAFLLVGFKDELLLGEPCVVRQEASYDRVCYIFFFVV